jgi:hypothetical protein
MLAAALVAASQVNYITTAPPSMDAYNHDAYTYLKKEDVSTGEPWVFETTLSDPQWAFVDMSVGFHRADAAPFPHCEIAVDGQVVVQADGDPYSARCALSQWH